MSAPEEPRDNPNSVNDTDTLTDTLTDTDDREAIFHRREVLIASALAGLGLAGCHPTPQPVTHPTTMPCVPPPVTAPDAGAPDAGAPDAGMSTPMACLSIAVPPLVPEETPEVEMSAPRPCLSIRRPHRTDRR